MLTEVRFEHAFIPELNRFQITSPDIKGFYITGSTREEAEREALAMVALIRSRQAGSEDRKLASVSFEAA